MNKMSNGSEKVEKVIMGCETTAQLLTAVDYYQLWIRQIELYMGEEDVAEYQGYFYAKIQEKIKTIN